MTLTDSFNLAFKTVKGNKLRTGITVAIIAFGIMALIGIITAIQAMNQSLRESFSSMGANAFVIKYKESRIRFGRDQSVKKTARGVKDKVSNLDKTIRREDAVYFKQTYQYPSIVSVYMRGPGNVECYYGDKKTNPVVTVWGGDENYLTVNGFTVAVGRNLNSLDVESGRNVCLLGSNVATKLFGDHPETAVDHIIKVGGIPYRIIGVLKSKGSSG
ncbi:MAG: ABC transporter permease, partial [Hydrotalea flava]|nr:ABC transporter permease [Hydrotalea flava]